MGGFTGLDIVGGIVAASMIWIPMWMASNAPRPPEPAVVQRAAVPVATSAPVEESVAAPGSVDTATTQPAPQQ